MISEINSRRSIRRYTGEPVSREQILALLEAGNRAPSAKNRQPWRFLVLTGKAKDEAVEAMRQGIAREKAGDALLPGSSRHLPGAEHTADIVEHAPVLILVSNPYGYKLDDRLLPEQRIYDLANLLSVGACVQNICLEAEAQGLGSLWICDIFFAYEELSRRFWMPGQIVTAVAIGHPDESPVPRPRQPLKEITEWREG